MSSLPVGLPPCYLSLGYVSGVHPVFMGGLHPQGWQNLTQPATPQVRGPGCGLSLGLADVCHPAQMLAVQGSLPRPGGLGSAQQAGCAKAAMLTLHSSPYGPLLLGEGVGGVRTLAAGAGLTFVTLSRSRRLQQGQEGEQLEPARVFDTWCFLSVCLGAGWAKADLSRPCLGRPVPVLGMVTSVGPVSEQGNTLSSMAQALTCWRQLSESWFVEKGF